MSVDSLRKAQFSTYEFSVPGGFLQQAAQGGLFGFLNRLDGSSSKPAVPLEPGPDTVIYCFYANLIPSTPNGDLIDVILKEWKGNYNKLEAHHGYIQWLFPLYEAGVNSRCPPMAVGEEKMIKDDPACKERVVLAYEMMLDFYGMKLVNRETGEIARAENALTGRYQNLVYNPHNFLRITRILTSLGYLGYPHYQLPWLEFLAEEIYLHGHLKYCQNSFQNFWMQTLLDTDQKMKLNEKIKSFSAKL